MKIKDFKCINCGSEDFKSRVNPHNHNILGIYCSHCGRWFKWANKNEKNLIMKRTL